MTVYKSVSRAHISKRTHPDDIPALSAAMAEWQRLRQLVFERDGWKCTYCQQQLGKKGRNLHCDHIHPVIKGGSDDLSNLTTACKSCNVSKSGMTVDEWMTVIGDRPIRVDLRRSAAKAKSAERTTGRRFKAMKLVCPQCGVLPGKDCIGGKGQPRSAVHAARIVTRKQAKALK